MESLKFMYRKTLVTLLLLPLFETIEDLFKIFQIFIRKRKRRKGLSSSPTRDDLVPAMSVGCQSPWRKQR